MLEQDVHETETGMWIYLLYGLISVMALKSLLALMSQHKKYHTYLLKQELAKQEAELAEQAAAEKLESQLDAASSKLEKRAG